MKLTEAYQILGAQEEEAPEEIKKKYKKLAKQFHPDLNKDPGAEDKYKQITQAYEIIQEPNKAEQDFETMDFGGFGGWTGIAKDFISSVIFNTAPSPQTFRNYPPITHPISLSFNESVLGTTRKITLQRQLKCDNCSGKGKISSLDKCPACNGKGQIRYEKRQGNQILIQQTSCSTCYGVGKKTNNCEVCKGEATIKNESNFDVAIPGGVISGLTLRLSNGGNFNPMRGRYDEAFLKITVQPDDELELDGVNVVSEVDISLLEALTGIKASVKTINGEQEISIPPKTKHLDILTIKGAGVPNKGNHLITLHVKYPENLEKVIEALKE